MENLPQVDHKNRFFYPKSPYRGHFTPQTFIFNANLQEFAQKVEYIAGLHSNGKMTTEDACQKLQLIWQELQKSQSLLDLNSKEF